VTSRIVNFLIVALALSAAALCAAAQQPLPNSQEAVDVTGHWVIEAKNWNGQLDTKTVDLQQQGNAITGHFKGPDQSGGLEGSVNGHHIVFRTKTKHPLTFRGQVQGDAMTGNYHVMGKEGEFHAERTAAK
jgi:opacity protein-like surface antigen